MNEFVVSALVNLPRWRGLPSACVPARRDGPMGLPIGVLITGRRLRKNLCLEAAEAIEACLKSRRHQPLDCCQPRAGSIRPLTSKLVAVRYGANSRHTAGTS
jgi:hypothetical protein